MFKKKKGIFAIIAIAPIFLFMLIIIAVFGGNLTVSTENKKTAESFSAVKDINFLSGKETGNKMDFKLLVGIGENEESVKQQPYACQSGSMKFVHKKDVQVKMMSFKIEISQPVQIDLILAKQVETEENSKKIKVWQKQILKTATAKNNLYINFNFETDEEVQLLGNSEALIFNDVVLIVETQNATQFIISDFMLVTV